MKSRIVIILTLLLCLTAGILIAGCIQQPLAPAQVPTLTPTLQPTSMPSAGIANPASVNCGKIGGMTEIKKSADGSEYGMCTFTNGTSCEEWALFRGEGCKTGMPITTTPTR